MTSSTTSSYTLPDLPYDYAALEPHVSGELMELHHDKHHAAYVKGANETLEKLAGAPAGDLPGLERAFAFHLGGHQLHSLFWQSMSPDGGGHPDGDLANAIDDAFGSFDAFQERFSGLMTSIQGVGWAALAWEPTGHRLVTFQLHDHQGTQVMGTVPLLVGDAWEHAYYLDYRNEKDKWAKAFMALADWRGAASRFEAARNASRVLEGVK